MFDHKNFPPTANRNISLYAAPFIPPRLVEGKVWYIVYYVVYPGTSELRRFRIKFNRIRNIKQRRELARQIITDLTRKLQMGWNPYITPELRKSYTSLFKALDSYLAAKTKVSEYNSMRCYNSFVKYLKDWLVGRGYSDEYLINQFTAADATDIMEDLRRNPRISPCTYNNYLKIYKSIWNWLLEYNYAFVNPFERMKRFSKKFSEKKRRTLTEEERQKLLAWLEPRNKNFLAICMLCYYCFLRPKEIVMLKVSNIDLERQVIFVPREIAKNDHDSVRTIPDVAMKYFAHFRLQNIPSNWYLFSWDRKNNFVPGQSKANSRMISNFWEHHVRTPLEWGNEKQFYSLKDTGITNMLSDNIAPSIVQSQADHSSLSITSLYIQQGRGVQPQIKIKAREFNKN